MVTNIVKSAAVRTPRAIVGGLFVVLWFASPGLAYEIDSHYHLRFAMSLATCFDWDEAHLIASGDWGLDLNRTTHAEMHPIRRRNKIGWHAFGHSDERFHELWQRSLDEPDLRLRLIKLGQFMHFLEDWESHAGYGTRMGHARDTYRGRDPDSLARSSDRNERMFQSALDHLLKTCEDLGRVDQPDLELVLLMRDVYDEGLLETLADQSDTRWKKGKLGGKRKRGPRILHDNRRAIEEFIDRRRESWPDKRIPDDFTPGDPLRGISPPLRLHFARDGGLEAAPFPGTVGDQTANEREPNLRVDVREADRTTGGFRIHVEVENIGSGELQGGRIEVLVIDSDDERVLGETIETLPRLGPGQSVDLRVPVDTVEEAGRDVIFSASAMVEDESAPDNQDLLMSQEVSDDQPDEALITDLDPEEPGPPRFVEDPGFHEIADAMCFVATALVPGGDSPAKLMPPEPRIVAAAGARLRRWRVLASGAPRRIDRGELPARRSPVFDRMVRRAPRG